MLTREELAPVIHESHRAQVAAGKTVAADKGFHVKFPFEGWETLGPNAMEGVKMNADYLLEKFIIIPKGDPVSVNVRTPVAQSRVKLINDLLDDGYVLTRVDTDGTFWLELPVNLEEE